VRTPAVVDEHVKDSLKVLLVQNQQPVETFRADSADESFRDAVRLRRAKRRPMTPIPALLNTSSNGSVNF
jgi:hypothetical protein